VNLPLEQRTGLLRRNAATKAQSKMQTLSLIKEGKRNESTKGKKNKTQSLIKIKVV